MQITLNQTEIETALRRYVNEQVNIREGHEVIIDLKAGRGENGFSATIDIVPADTPKASEPVAPSTATTSKPLGIQDKVRGKPQPVQETQIPDAPESAQEAAQEATPETATTAQAEPETAATAADAAQEQGSEGGEEEQAAPPETTDKPKSLFANLQKPRNS